MNRINQKTEFDLASLQSGDRSEFASMVGAYSGKIFRLALKMVKNQQDAEDILQETFIKAFHALPEFEGRSKLSTWLYRIATNEALMFLRRKYPDQISVEEPVVNQDESNPLEIIDWCCLPESELMSTEGRNKLEKSVDDLTESLRLVFLLRDIEGFSTRETAQILDISEGAVKTRLSRARLELRESLSKYYSKKLFSKRSPSEI